MCVSGWLILHTWGIRISWSDRFETSRSVQPAVLIAWWPPYWILGKACLFSSMCFYYDFWLWILKKVFLDFPLSSCKQIGIGLCGHYSLWAFPNHFSTEIKLRWTALWFEAAFRMWNRVLWSPTDFVQWRWVDCFGRHSSWLLFNQSYPEVRALVWMRQVKSVYCCEKQCICRGWISHLFWLQKEP